jgi:hypothetical protein
MGFPLSTDIFGQLAWLVKQVKLLVFRVTRLENGGGGGGGSQNLDQVLATGNTATNKTLKIVDTTQGTAELHGNYLTITSPNSPAVSTLYAYQQIGMTTGGGTYIGIGAGAGPSGAVAGMSIVDVNGNNTSYDGENVIVTDTSSNQTQLTSTFLTFIKTGNTVINIGDTFGGGTPGMEIDEISNGIHNSAHINKYGLLLAETYPGDSTIFANYTRLEAYFGDSVSSDYFALGRQHGYGAQLGFSIGGNAGNQLQANSTILAFALNNVETMLIGNIYGGNSRPGLTLNKDDANSIYDALNMNSSTIYINNTDSGDASYTQSAGFAVGNSNSPGVGASLSYIGTYITNGEYYNQSVANYSRVVKTDDTWSFYADASQGWLRIYDNDFSGFGNIVNTIKGNSITVFDNSTSQYTRLNFSPNTRSISTDINGYPAGINLSQADERYTIGNPAGASYFGVQWTAINSSRGLVGGSIRYDQEVFINPAGYIPITIDGIQYYIELWN